MASFSLSLSILSPPLTVSFNSTFLSHTMSFHSAFLPLTMPFNSTFVGSSHHIAQLYSTLNLDYTQLTWLERQWMAWYLWIGNPLLATGIASFILHEVRVPLPTLQRTAPSSPPLCRLSISVVAYHGSSSTQSHTFAGGNCNQGRYLHRRNSGSVPRVSSSPTSLLRAQP